MDRIGRKESGGGLGFLLAVLCGVVCGFFPCALRVGRCSYACERLSAGTAKALQLNRNAIRYGFVTVTFAVARGVRILQFRVGFTVTLTFLRGMYAIVGHDTGFCQLRVKFLETSLHSRPSIFGKFPGNLCSPLCRLKAGVAVEYTSFWQGLHFSRCRGGQSPPS